MSDPLELRALKALESQLQAMSAEAGYFFPIAETSVTFDLDEEYESFIESAGVPFVAIVVGLDGADGWSYAPADQVRIKLPVTLFWVHEIVAGDPSSRVDRLFKGSADLERAITADRSLGGTATDVEIQGRTMLDKKKCWLQMQLLITLDRTYGVP